MAKENWHCLSIKEAVRELGTDIEQGLSDEEARTRQGKFGLNKLPEEKPLSRLKIFLEQFQSPLVYILVIAGIVCLFFKLYTDSIVTFAAVAINTIVGYIQENKALRSLSQLKKVIKVEAQVIRDGREIQLDAENLVPGDIIVLSAGNKVPADGRLLMSHNLRINESPLTGEWLPARKTDKILPEATPLADRDNMVYMGCLVESGKGRAVITEIGKETEIGKVATLLKETKEEKTPLQKRIANFSKMMGLVIAVLCIFIFLGGIAAGMPALEMFTTAVAVAVAAVPEGLPVALTVILALGMVRILKRKGLVRKLIAAETLGSTSVICADKTLTLTEGKMEVSEIYPAPSLSQKESRKILEIAVLCNEAFIENPDDLPFLWRVRGRPTDRALLLAGAKAGVMKQDLEKKFLEIDEIPFDAQNKFIAKLYQAGLLYVSGAPEKILGFSKLNQQKLEELQKELEKMTGKGLRVVAVGYKKIRNPKPEARKKSQIPNPKSQNYNLEKEVNGLTFVGFIGLRDPVRKEAKGAIKVCIGAGMKPIIVTGDHKLTAKAVAKEIGFNLKQGEIIEGQELDRLSDSDFAKRIKDIQVYARVEPKHKMRIIEAWQKKGEVVAMTGDGINDAPALKKADIGVALGSGTDVAKQVSDLVLLTDNFNVIVAAVEEGRAIIDNIRKVITYLLSDSFTETILIGVSIILGLPLPVIAVQILWVNLIEDGPLGLCLAFEPKEKDLMARNPQPKRAPLLTKEMKALIFIIGLITDVLLLGLFFWLLKYSNYEIPHIQSVIFVGLAIDSIFYIFSCKSLRRNLWHINPFSNKFLILAWIFGVIMLLAALYSPPLQTLLRTVPLTPFDWQLILGLGLLNIILIETTKWHFIAKSK